MSATRSQSLEQASAVIQLDSHKYASTFEDEWTIGSVPHGGYVTTTIQKVARLHFETTLRKQTQPDTITIHVEFLRRTSKGPVEFVVEDTKLGRQTSTIHVTLFQDGRREVVAYITNTNVESEDGLSLDTHHKLLPEPRPANLQALRRDTDRHWRRIEGLPFEEFRKAVAQVDFHLPRQGQHRKSMADEWITLKSGEKFTNDSLGFVSDMWPQIVESYRVNDDDDSGAKASSEDQKLQGKRQPYGAYWYPTLVLNLDIKKRLPAEGVSFLFVRVQAKEIKNGRCDLEVTILDEAGDLVALSHHVALVVPAARNLAERITGKDSKL